VTDTPQASLVRLLEARRAGLVRDLARLTERPTDPVGNLSFGKRIGDGTTEAVERINTTAAARSVAASLQDVDRALAKLAEGTYGRCDACGRSIGAERLEAVPWTARCVECSARHAR
jgi:DnaK suppressor protein